METVPIARTALMFNLYETGLSDWENQKSKPMLMPAIKRDSTLYYSMDGPPAPHHFMLCYRLRRLMLAHVNCAKGRESQSVPVPIANVNARGPARSGMA
jgi:hypothetical protein